MNYFYTAYGNLITQKLNTSNSNKIIENMTGNLTKASLPFMSIYPRDYLITDNPYVDTLDTFIIDNSIDNNIYIIISTKLTNSDNPKIKIDDFSKIKVTYTILDNNGQIYKNLISTFNKNIDLLEYKNNDIKSGFSLSINVELLSPVSTKVSLNTLVKIHEIKSLTPPPLSTPSPSLTTNP